MIEHDWNPAARQAGYPVGEEHDPDPPALEHGAGRDLTCRPYSGATTTPRGHATSLLAEVHVEERLPTGAPPRPHARSAVSRSRAATTETRPRSHPAGPPAAGRPAAPGTRSGRPAPDRMRPSGKKHHGPDHSALILGDEMGEPPGPVLGGCPLDLLADLLEGGPCLAVRLDAHLITKPHRPHTDVHQSDVPRPPVLRQPD